MTDRDLTRLLARRNAALEQRRSSVPWSRLTPEERADEEALIARTENATDTIVTELRQRSGPVRIGDVVLHLTTDLDGFIEMDPKTRLPIHIRKSDSANGWRGLLYRYPAALGAIGRQNCPSSPMDVP